MCCHEQWKCYILRIIPDDTNHILKTRETPIPQRKSFNPPFAVSSDFVAVAIRVFVNETVELATRDFKFYNCAATVKKSENTP